MHREGFAQTPSTTGGPAWVKPAGLTRPGPLRELPGQKARSVTTVVTAGGVLRTVPVDPSTVSLTVGHAWIRPPAGQRDLSREGASIKAVSEVTPVVSVPVMYLGATGPRGGQGDAPVTLVVPEAPNGNVNDPAEVVGSTAEIAASLPEEVRNAAEPPVTSGSMSAQSRQQLSTFISTAVLPKTNQVYEKEWASFLAFVKTETGSDDPFLTVCTDDEKASLVALMMMRRHEAGKRGKAATAFTAAVRQMYTRAMRSTDFFDSSIIATARTSCLMKPDELRAARERGPVSTVKLPMCESLIAEMRLLLWVSGWTDLGLGGKSLYMGIAYGWETAGRIGEYTHCEPGNQNHCARKDYITFIVEVLGVTQNVLGSDLAALKLEDSVGGRMGVLECRVRTVSSKGKIVVKPKLVGRRSPEESEFLDDLTAWMTYNGTNGQDEAFSYRKKDGSLVNLTGRAVREEIKKTCTSNGLPPDYFSAHSLRKGAITHMRAQGATEDDRRDRGNYSAGSTVMNSVYDYATGLGPRASNSLEGGHRLDKKDIKRMIPARKSV